MRLGLEFRQGRFPTALAHCDCVHVRDYDYAQSLEVPALVAGKSSNHDRDYVRDHDCVRDHDYDYAPDPSKLVEVVEYSVSVALGLAVVSQRSFLLFFLLFF